MTNASRSSRLAAAALDLAAVAVPGVLLELQLGPESLQLVFAASALAVLAGQAWLLSKRGQTLGKMAMGVRIVRVADGKNPGFVKAVLLRWLANSVGVAILWPYAFLDALLIFREDRRCVHDFLAGTRVVKA